METTNSQSHPNSRETDNEYRVLERHIVTHDKEYHVSYRHSDKRHEIPRVGHTE